MSGNTIAIRLRTHALLIAVAMLACGRRDATAPTAERPRDATVVRDAGGPDLDLNVGSRMHGLELQPSEDAPWTVGTTARARVQATELAMHDGSYGAARLEVQAVAGGQPILTKKLEGSWRVLAYVAARRAFLLGGQFETGAWLPLDDLEYLDEATGAMSRSRVTADGHWIAFAVVPGPDGRFVAAIGEYRADQAFGAGRFRVQLLDAVKDALYDLGRPPVPPPAEDPPEEGGSRWQWGDPIDGVVDMDPGIITFVDAHTLRVTYGADTWKRRASRRTAKTWDPERVTAGPAIAPSVLGDR